MDVVDGSGKEGYGGLVRRSAFAGLATNWGRSPPEGFGVALLREPGLTPLSDLGEWFRGAVRVGAMAVFGWDEGSVKCLRPMRTGLMG